MTLAADISALLSKDALDEAVAKASSAVKANPMDKQARHLLIDLLIVDGDLERADAQCATAATFAPEDTMGFALLRNQLRGMAARKAWFHEGAVPQFPGGPSATDEAALKVSVAHRAQDGDATRTALAAMDEARGAVATVWNGAPIADLRDLDDRTAHCLEALTTGGAYLWIDFTRIAALVVEPIARPRDIAYRRAELTLADGASAPVLLPAIYAGSNADAALKLGRRTEWVDEPTGLTTGRGLRCLLAGDEMVTLHELERIDAASADEAQRQARHG